MTPPAGIGACLYHGIQCRDAPSNARRGAAAISNFLRTSKADSSSKTTLRRALRVEQVHKKSDIAYTTNTTQQRTLLRELRMVLSDEGIDEGFGLIALGIQTL